MLPCYLFPRKRAWHGQNLADLEEVAAERRKRISTSEMNRFLKHVDFDRASVPARQRVKIYY